MNGKRALNCNILQKWLHAYSIHTPCMFPSKFPAHFLLFHKYSWHISCKINAYAIPTSHTFHTYPIKKAMPKLNPKNIKNKVKNTQKYLQNLAKMGSKSLPGNLLGTLLQKVVFLHLLFVPMEVQWEPRGSPKINKNH